MGETSSAARAVHKFGGAALADGAGVRRVGALLASRAPARPIAVVSAIEGVTSALDEVARGAAAGRDELAALRVKHRSHLAQLALEPELLDRHFAELATLLRSIRERGELSASQRDHVLSFGERMSARIVAAHLSNIGVRAVPIDAFDLGLVSDSNHGRARVLPHSAERVRSALARIEGIPVVTGFVAQDAHGRLTTLGRNGSDLSAALIAEAIGASEVCFWKDVGGVMTADPKLVPHARVVAQLSYDEAAVLTAHGASVLHADAVHPLARARIPARVLCVRNPTDAGTLVSHESAGAVAIACRRGLAFAKVAADEASVRAALERASLERLELGGVKVVVAPWSETLEDALHPLAPDLSFERELASLTVVGEARCEELDEALRGAGVSVRMNYWDRAKFASWLVREVDLPQAARALHEALFTSRLVEGGSR